MHRQMKDEHPNVSKTVLDTLRNEDRSRRARKMLSEVIAQAVALSLLPLVLSTTYVVAQPPTAVAKDATLIHGGAFTQQLSLVGSDLSVEHLALTDEDVRYTDLTVDQSTGDVYFSTSNSSIQRARYDAKSSPTWEVTTVIGGQVEVRVEGYNLGASAEDVVYFAIRGVECRSLRRDSSNSLACVLGDPTVTGDLGEGIGPEDVVVQTAIGGWTHGGHPGDFVDAQLADHSLKPIISRVEVAGRAITPRALCFDDARGHLYFSDHGTRSVSRIRFTADNGGDESAQTVELDFEAFLPDVGMVHGMAVDGSEGPNGGYLYFSETEHGTISRVELPADGNQPVSAEARQVLASGLLDPTGVALEPNEGARLFFALRGGSIRVVMRDGSVSTAVSPSALLDGGGYEVRRFDSGTRLEGIAISENEDSTDDPTRLRLYWVESGRTSRIKRSTLDGTRPEEVLVLDEDEQDVRLIWPRGLVFGAGASEGLLFCEYLGSVRLLPHPAGGRTETVVAADSYPAAKAVQALIAGADREGIKGRFFTQGV